MRGKPHFLVTMSDADHFSSQQLQHIPLPLSTGVQGIKLTLFSIAW